MIVDEDYEEVYSEKFSSHSGIKTYLLYDRAEQRYSLIYRTFFEDYDLRGFFINSKITDHFLIDKKDKKVIDKALKENPAHPMEVKEFAEKAYKKEEASPEDLWGDKENWEE